jgi:hypothetical protein
MGASLGIRHDFGDVPIRVALLVLLAALAVGAGAFLARSGDAAPAASRCAGAFPPERPELAGFRVTKMPCWAAKLLLDEALERDVGRKNKIALLGFICRFKRETEASGVVTCTGRGMSARAAFSVF